MIKDVENFTMNCSSFTLVAVTHVIMDEKFMICWGRIEPELAVNCVLLL